MAVAQAGARVPDVVNEPAGLLPVAVGAVGHDGTVGQEHGVNGDQRPVRQSRPAADAVVGAGGVRGGSQGDADPGTAGTGEPRSHEAVPAHQADRLGLAFQV